MSNEEFEPSHDITPDMIWGRPGIYQQVFFALITVSIWVIVQTLHTLNPVKYLFLSDWQERIKSVLSFDHYLQYILLGLLIGLILSLVFLTLEYIVSILLKENWIERLNKNDYLLPVTKAQRKHALAIILSGSVLEEVLFRAYLLYALLPLWNSWIWAAIIISAFFALVHTNIQGFTASVWIFFSSLLFIYLLIRFESLFLIIIIHISINLLNIFVIPNLFGKDKS